MTARNRPNLHLFALIAGFALMGALAAQSAGTLAAPRQAQTVTPTPTTTPPPQQGAQAPAQGRASQTGGRPGGAGPGRMGGPTGPAGFRGEWEWWKDDDVKRQLGLTDKVAADIDNVFQRRQREVMPYVDAWNHERDVLDKMTRERTVDEPTYSLQVSRVVALQSKLNETRAVMLYHVYLKLTPEQYQKLNEARDRHFQRGRGAGGH